MGAPARARAAPRRAPSARARKSGRSPRPIPAPPPVSRQSRTASMRGSGPAEPARCTTNPRAPRRSAPLSRSAAWSEVRGTPPGGRRRLRWRTGAACCRCSSPRGEVEAHGLPSAMTPDERHDARSSAPGLEHGMMVQRRWGLVRQALEGGESRIRMGERGRAARSDTVRATARSGHSPCDTPCHTTPNQWKS